MKKLCDWIKNIFAAIRINWKLFLFFNSKKKQKKFEEEMKEITENVKKESVKRGSTYSKRIRR